MVLRAERLRCWRQLLSINGTAVPSFRDGVRRVCAWASSRKPSHALLGCPLIFPPTLPLLASSDTTIILTRDPHIAKEGELMGLHSPMRRLVLEAPSPAFPSESCQPVSASVQAREGREEERLGQAGRGQSGLPSFGPLEHPCSSSEDGPVLHCTLCLLAPQESGSVDRLGEQDPQGS